MLNIIFNETQKLLEEVANFSLDFAISDDTFSPQFAAKILRRPIFKEELVLVCSKNYFKVHENSFPELQKMKELTYLGHSSDLPFLQRWFKAQYKKQMVII